MRPADDPIAGATADLCAAVRARLASAVRIEDPFPHVIVESLLPEDAFRRLADTWPDLAHFWSDRPNKFDLVPMPAGTAPADARAEAYEQLPADARAAWDTFIMEVNRRVVGPYLARIFAPEIEERLALLDSARRAAAPLPPYLQPPFRPQMNVGRLMVRGHGYRLRPHVDALAYLATALYYFPREGDTPDMGTTLYRVDRPLEAAALAVRGKTVYFDEAGITLARAVDVPFRPNSLLAFANTPRSAHGMTITGKGVLRRAFQSHLSLKGDHDHL